MSDSSRECKEALEAERWEEYYREAMQRDFERAIYRRCDEEDSKERP